MPPAGPPVASSSARVGSYPPPGPQNVAPQPNQPPVYRPTGTTVRSRNRARFVWTDPVWLAPAALWIAVALNVDWQRQASLLAITSIAVAILGYAIDCRMGRRLPWWAKGVIPLGVGFVLGYTLHVVGAAFALAILLLLISVGVAWLLLRRPTR